eukprot:TRINITY_DN6061_c0_g1_i3.p1 TRINITY_DN6061_c0_g1~~TRINITY_DN6061_c0_g1_i3.p1  ORF type:complete len:773 (+),score=131.82 TRINITY_DN6061_c0_g1_i3:85-2403(+)
MVGENLVVPRAVSSGSRRVGPLSRSRGPSRGRSRGSCGGGRRSTNVCSAPLLCLESDATTIPAVPVDFEEKEEVEPRDAQASLMEDFCINEVDALDGDDEDNGASGVILSLLDEAIDDYAEEAVREVLFADEAEEVFQELEAPILEAAEEDSEADETDSDDTSVDLLPYESKKFSEANAEIADALTLSVVREAIGRTTRCIIVPDELLSQNEASTPQADPPWPRACDAGACTRPRFQRHLCPSTIGPFVPEEPFPLDCLPLSAPVACSLAPAAELSVASRRLAGLPMTSSHSQPPFFAAECSVSPPRLSFEASDLLLRRASESLAALASAARWEASETIQRCWRHCHRQKEAFALNSKLVPGRNEQSAAKGSVVPSVEAIATPAPPPAARPRGANAPRRRFSGMRAPTDRAAPAPADVGNQQPSLVEAGTGGEAIACSEQVTSSSPAFSVHSQSTPPCASVTPVNAMMPVAPSMPMAPRTLRQSPRPGSGVRLSATAQAQPTLQQLTQAVGESDIPTPSAMARIAPCPRPVVGTSPAARKMESAASQAEPTSGERRTGAHNLQEQDKVSARQDVETSLEHSSARPPRPRQTSRTPRKIAVVPTTVTVQAAVSTLAPVQWRKSPRTASGAISVTVESPRQDPSSVSWGTRLHGSLREQASPASAMELDLGCTATTSPPRYPSASALVETSKVEVQWGSSGFSLPPSSPRRSKPLGTGLLPSLPPVSSVTNGPISWSMGVSPVGVTTPRHTKRSTSASRRLRGESPLMTPRTCL